MILFETFFLYYYVKGRETKCGKISAETRSAVWRKSCIHKETNVRRESNSKGVEA